MHVSKNSEAKHSSHNGKNIFNSLNTKWALKKSEHSKATWTFHLNFIFTQVFVSNFFKSHFLVRLYHYQNNSWDTTSRGVLNPSPGLHVKRASAFLRPPLRLAKMAACFWKALSVYPVTIGEKNEKKKRGEKQTINHATKQNGERVIIGMQFKNIVDQNIC